MKTDRFFELLDKQINPLCEACQEELHEKCTKECLCKCLNKAKEV